MNELEAWLNSNDAPENIESVFAPTTEPDFADMLISPDQRIALVSVRLNTPTDAAVFEYPTPKQAPGWGIYACRYNRHAGTINPA